MTEQLNDVLLTAHQVAGWIERKTELEGKIEALQKELGDLSRKLEAVAIIRGDRSQQRFSFEGAPSDSTDSKSMMEVVARIAAQAPGPLTKKQIKRQLVEEGFSPSRLGNYFYTVIARLKERERIYVLPDGRVKAGAAVSLNGSAGIAHHD